MKKLLILGGGTGGAIMANKMRHELDEKGYIDSVRTITKNLANTETVDALVRLSQAVADVTMNDQLDDKSFRQLFKQMRSREVRKSLSYSMRLLEAINKK
ncbi:MAG: hypothetical protein ISS17_08625 [Bacteroidales bacterium]|nr:hypothetical protein [Bacteroidales bacterium]